MTIAVEVGAMIIIGIEAQTGMRIRVRTKAQAGVQAGVQAGGRGRGSGQGLR